MSLLIRFRAMRIRFGLASLLMFFTVISCYFASCVNHAGQQRSAVAAVRGLGGIVRYDWQPEIQQFHQFSLVGSKQEPAPSGPKWLRERVGDEYFQSISQVYLRGGVVNDRSFAEIGRLPHGRSLDVTNSQITDDGLRFIGKMPTLEHLGISGNRISDAGLVHLASLRELRELFVGATDITNRGLESIVISFPDLRQLDLKQTSIDDEGMRFVSSLASLEILWIANTNVTDRGLENIGDNSKIYRLDLSFTNIGDPSMESLLRLNNLKYLKLRGTHITDAGLQRLAKLPTLKTLDVSSTRVTESAVASLRKASPGPLSIKTGGYYQRTDKQEASSSTQNR